MKEAGINDDIVLLQEEIENASKKLLHLSYLAKAKKYFSIVGNNDSDIYIQTLHKSGTTLMQMMVYQLTTDGNMDFDHIYDVSPWTGNLAYLTKKDFEGYKQRLPNYGKRNIYKSHFEYSFYKNVKKGKFIYVIRDVFDQINSYYHHFKNYYNPDLKFDEFVDKGIIEKWFKYNTEWIKNENENDIIYLNFEDIIESKLLIVNKLSDFLNIPMSEEKLERVLERSSFPFMKSNEKKFGEQPQTKVSKVYNKFIRKGIAGEGKSMFTKEHIIKVGELANTYLGSHKLTKRYFNK